MSPHLGILKEKGFKITPLRKAMLEVFRRKQVTLTPEELFRFIKRQIPGAGLQSVYRNLTDFSKAGITEEVIRKKRKSSYTLCNGIEDHHHHAVCRGCGKSVEVRTCDLKSIAKALDRLKARIGFQIERHFLQLEGLCRDCQK